MELRLEQNLTINTVTATDIVIYTNIIMVMVMDTQKIKMKSSEII